MTGRLAPVEAMKASTPSSSVLRARSLSSKTPSRAAQTPIPGVPAPPSSDICPNCGSSHLIRDEIRGEIVCADCGLVVDQSALVSDRGQRGSKEDTGREARGLGTGDFPSDARQGTLQRDRSSHAGLPG